MNIPWTDNSALDYLMNAKEVDDECASAYSYLTARLAGDDQETANAEASNRDHDYESPYTP